jgi:hypothetical protein
VLSLGVTNTPEDGRPYSHGDAGVFIVDVNTGEVETYGGYGFGNSDPELPLVFGLTTTVTLSLPGITMGDGDMT